MLAIRKCLLCSSRSAKHGKHKHNSIPSSHEEDFRLISTNSPHALPKQAKPQPKSEPEGEAELGREPWCDENAVEEPRPNETAVLEEVQFDENLVKAQIKTIVGVEARLGESLMEDARSEKIIVEEAQPDKTIVEEAKPDDNPKELAPLYQLLLEEPDESKLNQMFRELIGPCDCTEELLSINSGLHESDRTSLHLCSEILGSESCDNMVKDMSEAVTEWGWRRKRQRNKVINSEMLASMGLPPPIPRYAGRPCRFMKVKRCNGRLTMNEIVMDSQPQVMHIERDDGHVKMQLMTYVGDVKNDDDEAVASAFYYREAFHDDAEASTSASYVKDAMSDDAEASTSAMHVRDAMTNDVDASTSAFNVEHARNIANAEASTSALLDGDVWNDGAFYEGHVMNNVAEACISGSTLEKVAETSLADTSKEGATDSLNRRRKGKMLAAKAA